MQKDNIDLMYEKRWKDAKDFLKKDFDVKVVDAEFIEKMWDWEVVYFQYYCGMGMDDIYNDIWIFENWVIKYYRKYIYVFKTDEYKGPGFLAIKSFMWLENYDDRKNFEHNNKYSEIFEFIDLHFWNYLLVNKKYFDDYWKFIKMLSKKYGLGEIFFWIKITTVSKIFHSGNKEKFLSMSN